MSSSSLRQHQRKSVINSTGHSPLARNHSVGAPTQHHSSSTSFSSHRSYKSLPSPTLPPITTTPTPTKKTTTTTTTIEETKTDANILYEDEIIDNQLNEKSPNSIVKFDQQINNFHNSSINQKINELHMPRSTRHLCGTIIPLQSSTSSPNIDHRVVETEKIVSPILPTLPYRKPDIKYRFLSLLFFFL